MNEPTDYKAIVFTTFKSQSGFIVHATQRGDKLEDCYKLLGEFIKKEKGIAYEKQSGFAKKPIEYVANRKCPKCNANLVYQVTKAGKIVKCETNKWDFVAKKATGCPYVEFPRPEENRGQAGSNFPDD